MKIDDTNDYLQLATRERVHSICLTLERSPVKLDGKFLAGIHAPKAPSTGFQAEGLELEVREAARSAGSTSRPQVESKRTQEVRRGGAKRRLNEPTPTRKQANSRRCAQTARSAVFKCRPQVESKRTQEVRRGGAKRRLNEPTPTRKQANSRRCAKTARSAVFKCRPMVVGRQGARAARLVRKQLDAVVARISSKLL